MNKVNNHHTANEASLRELNALFEECRDACLWFWNRKGVPNTSAEKREALHQIELHGSVQQFKRARELEQWL